jgi:hypothetical protein
MRNITHYYFAVAIILIDIWVLNPVSPLEKLFLSPVVIGAGFLALLPNKLDAWFCIDRKTRTCTERCRHPLTHHPGFLLGLIWCFEILPVLPQYYQLYHLLTRMILISFSSHLVLDLLTPEGLPLGRTPTLFCQDEMKNYSFNDTMRPRIRLRLFQGIVSRDSSNVNEKIILASKSILLAHSVMLVLGILSDPEIIFSLYYSILTHGNQWIMLLQGELNPCI